MNGDFIFVGCRKAKKIKALSDAQRLSGQWRIEVRFEVQPTTELLHPEGIQPKPHTHGPETALVCGPDADTAQSDIYTDPLGRIKVQFPWDRYGAKNHNSSCWVRVSAAWAGNQLGAMHVPRIGQEVIVDFLGGDPDQPICTGRVYNQMNTPPWALPAQQALSGFRSRELKPGGGNSAAGRSNHLVLDDTDQKIQAQIKSDHQHSQLSLGHITRIEDNAGRKDHRGEGFELRTDGHGAVRAKDGLLISTEGRPNANGHITHLSETAARLQNAHSQHDSLGDLALQHQAQEASDQGDVAKAIEAQNKAIAGDGKTEGKFPELSEPHLVLASPAGIESTTPQSTHQHSGQHHAITSGGHTSVSAGKSLLVSAEQALRLFSYKAGIKIVSAMANVDMQALDKSIRFLAKVKITQTANRITFTAKEEIVINGGGSFTTFKASGIEDGTSGGWTNHAANHATPKGKSLPVVMPAMPRVSQNRFHQQFRAVDPGTGQAVAGLSYQVVLEDGKKFAGKTDSDGKTAVIATNEPNAIQLFWGGPQTDPEANEDIKDQGC
ncbi:type VI secretion system Vgr family protein [Limnohabitans sp. DM1]|uniref:DUF2345 domain-containing protein n=1 Tax=Limnohabitans sp. DM1 TaxID=1597955 RepID=UPI000AF8783E|nr:type VI secretion system Vgr family protein [Limnohabitans sp. DM1]